MTTNLATPASPHAVHRLHPPTARPKFAGKSGPFSLVRLFEKSETATPDTVSDEVSLSLQCGGKVLECGRRLK